MGEIPSFAFEKLRGFKPSQFGPFCAKCVCASASVLPQRSLGCESQRLEVSGPGGCKVFERACGGVREEEEGGGPFPASTCYLHQKPQDFYTKRKMCCKMSLM